MTTTFESTAGKNGEQHNIFLQVFGQVILAYDTRNPAGWQVGRANTGADAVLAKGR